MTVSGVVEGYASSEDGTRIGFLRRGERLGLVLLQGAGTAADFASWPTCWLRSSPFMRLIAAGVA